MSKWSTARAMGCGPTTVNDPKSPFSLFSADYSLTIILREMGWMFQKVLSFVFLAVSWLLSTVVAGQSTESVSVDQQVRSILSNRCFACHGPDEKARKADLRLDTREGALDWAVDLEDPESSEVIARIRSDDPDSVMPPPKHGEPLTAAEQDLFLQWIRAGANYPQHWSYVPPQRPEVPESVTGSAANEIDCFVEARLVGTDLRPSPQADRYTLIRRLALDLTGLPPTTSEVEKFVADDSGGAYESLVDYYLEQPAFAERWAAVWLDLARYADSAGFAEDKKRTIWAYRDYVIQSYLENKPFDQFTIEQLAGDLLPDANDQTRIATAFHRNTLTNSEGGTSDEEFRSAAVVDRVNTTMAVWMGTTMACAQCHTHKYDPITQAEYFQFYDFLNQTADADRPNESPVLSVFTDKAKRQRAEIQSRIAETEAALNQPIDEQAFGRWKTEILAAQTEPISGRFVRIELPGSEKILSLAEVEVFTTNDQGVATNVATSGKASQSSTAYEGPPEYAIDGNTEGDFEQKSVTHTATQNDPWWQVDLAAVHPIDRITVWNRTGANLHTRLNGYRLSIRDENQNVVWSREFPTATAAAQSVEVQELSRDILALLQQTSEWTDVQSAKIREHYLELRNRKTKSALSRLQAQLDQIKPQTTVPVLEALDESKRRVTKVQIRGSFLDTAEEVTAATPAAFHRLPDHAPRNRLTLARWLVDRDNPLTARVVVNRYWEQLFGIGIVKTSEEFGAQGELPSHPKLLDWLAVDLMEHGWDTKRLLKQIVMSRTYRQTSYADSQAIHLDPDNRLLGRGPRVRLSAEMIRDQALAVSGLLSSKMFGPPVHPPQPKVGLKPAFTGQTTDWTDSIGEDRYRRGIYTEWRRSSPYPSMSTFDVNSREVCEIRRSITNTPLQALVTLNDPVYVEAAQALARRVITESGAESPQQKSEFAFRLCLIRKPTELELERIVDLYEQTRKHFSDQADAAAELAVDPLNPPAEGSDLIELATWTTVANVLLNLDEMLMKP